MADKPDPKAENAKDPSTEPVKPTSDSTASKPDAGDSHVVSSTNPNVQTDVAASSMTDAVEKAQTLNQAERLDQTGTQFVQGPDKSDMELFDSSKEPASDAAKKTGDSDQPEKKEVTKSADTGVKTEQSESKPDAGTEAILSKLPADHQRVLEGLPPDARANFAKQINGMEGEFAQKMKAQQLSALVDTFNKTTKNGETAKIGDTINVEGVVRSIQAERARSASTANRGGSATAALVGEAPPARTEVTDPNHGTIAEARQPVKRETSTPAAPADVPSSQIATGDVPVTVVKSAEPVDIASADPRKAEAEQRQAAGDKQVSDFIATQTGEAKLPADSRKSIAQQGFEPKPGAYNPVNVPGFSEEGVGEQHSSLKESKVDNYDIESRQMSSMTRNSDNSITRTYTGAIDTAGMISFSSDTTFQAHETITKDNKLESRSVTYNQPLELKFDTPDGPKKIADVKAVDTKYDAARDRYVSTIRSADGSQHEAIVKTDGSVEKFEQTVKLTTAEYTKGVETKVWQDRNGTITQVQEGDERWSKQSGTDKWVKQNANGDYIDANNKVVSSASEAASFTGRYEFVTSPQKGLAKVDTAQQQAITKYADGSQERLVGLKGAPEFTVRTSADGKVSLDSQCGHFSVDDKSMEVLPNGDIKFRDTEGQKILNKDGSLTSTYSDRTKSFQSVTEGFSPDGGRYIKSITFGEQAKISGMDMAGTWTVGEDGKYHNGSKTFDGEMKVKDLSTLSFTTKSPEGVNGEGILRADGSSYTAYYDAGKNFSKSVEGLKDGSTIERRYSFTADEQKDLKERYGDNLVFNEISRTDAKGQTIKLIEATTKGLVGGEVESRIVQATDATGKTWSLLSQEKNTWGEIDAKGKPVKGTNGEQNTFTGNWALRKDGSENSTVTRIIGSQSETNNAFSARFLVDYRSDGEITITNQEVPMIGYSTDAKIGPGVQRGANGDLTITSVNTKDQLTIKANGHVVSSNLALNPYGTTGLVEGTDAAGQNYVKEITFNGQSTTGPGAGTWRRSGDSSSEKWEQIDSSGKPTGKTFDGEITMNSRLSGDMTIKDNKKHTVDSVTMVTGFERHEQYASNNKDLVSSYEKAPDKSTITHEVTDSSKTAKEYGLDENVKPPIDKVVVTDANGNKITYYNAKDGEGNEYTARVDAPSGTWIRGGDRSSNQWNKVTAEKNEKGDTVYKQTGETFYGNVERVGKTAIFTNDRDNQRTYYQPDGSFERQLLTEKTEVLSNLDVRSTKQPEYTIRSDARGNRSIVDNNTGKTYSTTDGAGNPLKVDDKGNMTFTDGSGRTITIAQDGSRKVVDANKNELTTDAGGRMLQQKDANGKTVANYNYEQKGDQVYLKSFENASGYWEMTQLADGKQKWDLMNGKDGATATMQADRIYINRDNSMVLENGDQRTVRKLDGTEIVQTSVMTGDITTTTVVVGKRDGENFTPAYTLKTTTDKHDIQTQELESAGERAVRGKDGIWTSTDLKTGEVTKFAGQISIDDSGTLRKVTFETERNGDTVTVLKNKDGTPRISNTVDVYTNGSSWQSYENGAMVSRDRDGDVQFRQTAAGEVTRIDYSTTSPKEVVGFSQGNTYWKFNKETGKYVPTDINNPSKILDQQNDAQVTITINNRNGDIVRTNIPTGDVNTSKLDGTTELHRKDNTIVYTDSQGRPTKQIDANKNEFDLTYGPKGDLSSIKARIYTGVDDKGQPTYKDMMVRTEDYTGPGAETAIVGKNLKIEGFNDRYLAYENSKGHRVEIYPDTTMREYAGKDVTSGVIRVDLPSKVTVLAKGYDEKSTEQPFEDLAKRGPIIRDAEIVATPKTDFDRLRALGRDVPAPPATPQEIKASERSIIYKNADGNVVERWANGATQEFQKVPKTPGSSETVTRIKSSTDSTGRYIEYSYDDSKVVSTVPNKIEITAMVPGADGKMVPSTSVLQRDKDGNATWTEAGKQPVAIKNFNVLDNRIMIAHTSDDPNNPKFLEFIDTRNATSQAIGKDRSLTDFDAQGRMTHKRDAAGNEFNFFYKGNDTIPSTLQNMDGSWTRQVDSQNPNSSEQTWVHAESGAVWKGTVSTEGGIYKFENAEGKQTVHQADGTDKSTYRDGTVEVSKEGKVLSVTDTTGNITKYEYGEDGNAPYPTDFKVYNADGKVVANSDSFVKRNSDGSIDTANQIKKIEIDPASGRPVVTYNSDSVMKLSVNGVGIVSDKESKITGLFRPEDHKFIESGKDGVKEITVDKNGKIEIKKGDGSSEYFKSEGTRVVTDAAGNSIEAHSIDGVTVLKYDYSVNEKTGKPELTGLTRTTKDQKGVDQITKIVKEGDKFVERSGTSEANLKPTGNVYDSMSSYSDNVYFYNKAQKTQRTIDANGTEWEVRRFGEGSDERFTRVERDTLGRVTTVQDQNYNITHFVRNADGELTRIIQGDDELFKTKENTWVSSANPDLQIHLKDGAAGPTITANGDQIWQDKDNVTRTVKADGSVEISRPDGSQTIISADGSLTRTIYSPTGGGEVQEVRAGKDGSVQVIMRNGDVLSQSAYSKIITSTTRTPAEFEGSLEVGKDGQLTFFTQSDKSTNVYFSDGRAKYLQHVVTGDIGAIVSKDLKGQSPENIKAITDAIKARPADAESVLKEYGIDKDSAQGRQLMKDLEAAMMYTDKNSEAVYNSLNDLGAVGPYRIDNEFNMNDAREVNTMNRGMDALNRSYYAPEQQTPTNSPQPGQIPQTQTNPNGPPPGSDLAGGSPPISDHGQAQNVVDENARRIEATLKTATKADGKPLSSEELKDVASQLSSNPQNAEALLKEKGFDTSTAKALSDTIKSQHDTANDTARDDIIKQALKDGGVPANRIDEIAGQIKADPNNIQKILERNSVPADSVPKIMDSYKSDIAALDKAAGSIIGDNLKRSGLPAEKQAEVAAQIQAHPENALQILKDAGVPEANATRIANEINKDMRTFNQIRETAESRHIDAQTAASVALETYNSPENVTAALARAGVDVSVAREVGQQASRDVVSDNVIVAPTPVIVAPAQNGPPTDVIRTGSHTNVNDIPPNTTDVANDFNRSRAQVDALNAAAEQQRVANFEQKREVGSKADERADRVGDEIAKEAIREEARAKERLESDNKHREEQRQQEQRDAEKRAEEQQRVQKQQEEERTRREEEQRKQTEEIKQRQEQERRELEERQKSERERADKARLESLEREQRAAKENLLKQQEQARLERDRSLAESNRQKDLADQRATGGKIETEKPAPVVGKFEGQAQTNPRNTTDSTAPTTPSRPPETRGETRQSDAPRTTTPGSDVRQPEAPRTTPGSETRQPDAPRTTPGSETRPQEAPRTTTGADARPPEASKLPGSSDTRPDVRPSSTPPEAGSARPTTVPGADLAKAQTAGSASAPDGALKRDAAGNFTKVDANGSVIKVDASGKPITTKDAPLGKTGELGPDGKPVEHVDTKGDTSKTAADKGDGDHNSPIVVPGTVTPPAGEVVQKPAGPAPAVPVEGGALDRSGTAPAGDIVKGPGKMSDTVAENTVDKVTPQPGPVQPGSVSGNTTTTANQSTGATPPGGQDPAQTVPAGQAPGHTPPATGSQATAPATDPLNRSTVDPSGNVTTLPAGSQPPAGQTQTQTQTGKEPSAPAGTQTSPVGTAPTQQQGQGQNGPTQGQGQTPAAQDPSTQTPGAGTAPQPAGQGQTQPQQPSTTAPSTDPLNRNSAPSGTATQPTGQAPAGQTQSGQAPTGQEPSQQPSGQTPPGQTTTGTGQAQTGQTQTGQTQSGQPTSQTPAGQTQTPAGQAPAGQTPAGQQTTGSSTPDPLPKTSTDPGTTTQVPAGQTQPGQSTTGQTTTGQSTTGQPTTQTPTGQTSGQTQTGQQQTTPTGSSNPDPLPKTSTEPGTTTQVPAGQTQTGQSTTGQTTTGQTTTNQPASGQQTTGQTPTGQTPTGQQPSGQTGTSTPDPLPKTGTEPGTTTQVPTGQTQTGQSTTGQTTTGQTTTNQPASGQQPTGQTPTGQQTSGQTGTATPDPLPKTGTEPGTTTQVPSGQSTSSNAGPTGQTTTGQTTTGQPPAGQTPSGQTSTGQTTTGQTTTGQEPAQQLPKQSDPGSTSTTTGHLPTSGQTTPSGQTTGQTDPQGQQSPSGLPSQTVPSGHAGQTQNPTGTTGQHGTTSTPTSDPSTSLPKTVDPNAPASTTGNTTTSTHTGTTQTGTGQTGTTSTGTTTTGTTQTGTSPTGTGQPGTAQTQTPQTGSGTQTGTTQGGTVPNGNATTDPSSVTPASTTTSHATQTTSTGNAPAGPSSDPGSIGNASSHGNAAPAHSSSSGQAVSAAAQDMASQIATTAVVVAVINSMSSHGSQQPQVQQRPTVDPGSTTVSSTPTQLPSSAPSSYSQPANHSGSTTYTPPASSTTSNTDPSSNTSGGSTTISTGSSTTHTSSTSTQAPASPQPASEPTSSSAQPQSTKSEPNQVAQASEPTAQPSPQYQSNAPQTNTATTPPSTHAPSVSTTVQPVTLQQQPQSSNPAHSISNTSQNQTAEPAHSTATSQAPQPAPANSGNVPSNTATQNSTSSAPDPSQASSVGNTDDEQSHSHASAATHANATQQGPADPGQNAQPTTTTVIHTQTANRSQHQGQQNAAPQPRQAAQPTSHNTSGAHGQQGQTPAQQAPAHTASGGTTSGNSSSSSTSGNTDPTATTAANSPSTSAAHTTSAVTGAHASATSAGSQTSTGQGSSADPAAKANLNNADPNNDPNAVGIVSNTQPDPSSSSSDPTANSQDPAQSQTSQDPSMAQDPSMTQDPAGVQDPSMVQDPSTSQDPSTTQEPSTTQTQAQDPSLAQQRQESSESQKQAPSSSSDQSDVTAISDRREEIEAQKYAYDSKETQLREPQESIDKQHVVDDWSIEPTYDAAAERARIEAQVDSYFESQKTIDPPFVDMSGDRVIEKHMPDGTTLLTFNDGVSAWVKGDQVTVIDSEGDISSFVGRIDTADGNVTIYDANDIVIHSTEPIVESAGGVEQSHYTFVYSNGEENKQVQIPSDWSISFGDDGNQIVSDASGNPMILLDGDSAKYVGPEEFQSLYGDLDGDVTILDTVQSVQSSAGRVTLLDFNPGSTDSTVSGVTNLLDSSAQVLTQNPQIDALGPEQAPATVDPNAIDPYSVAATTDPGMTDPGLPMMNASAQIDPILDAFNDPPASGSAIDPVAGMPIDPTTGLPYNPETGKLLDPSTGQEIGNYVAQDNSFSGTSGIISGDKTSPVAENPGINQPEAESSQNLADILNDEILRIHDNIESRLEEIRNGVHGTRIDDDSVIASFAPESASDVSSRIDDIDKVADEREQHKQDRIKDEEERKRDEEEERLKKRKEDIKKLADTMQAIIATKRREEMERVRKLLEQQRKIEEFIVKDTRQSKYTVRYGDTLESIAKKMFKDPRVATLIYDMNKSKVTVENVDGKSVYHVKPGTELKLPSPRQAREWVMRGKHMQTEQAAADKVRKITEKEKAELDDRRKHVESMLGAVGYVGPNTEDGGVKYNVRLGDSLRSVAMKHPMLNDVSLWRLLAEKNDLPTTTDNHGIPTAILKRGTKLLMPTKQEIVDFRKKIGVLTHPASTWINNTSKDGPESSIHSKKCSDCKRQAPIGVAICPSCGHIFESVITGGVAKQSFTIVTKPPKAGIQTKDDSITADSNRKSGVKTKDDEFAKDPLVETADDNKVVDLSSHGVSTSEEVSISEEGEPATATASGVKTNDQSGVKTTEERKPFVSTSSSDNGVPTEEDRTVFVNPGAAVDPSSAITQELGDDYESTVIVKDGIVTAQLPDDSDSTVIVTGAPKQPISDAVSASESLLQGISSLHKRGNTGGVDTGGVTTGGITTGGVTSQQLQVERFTEQLSETCRLVQLDSSRANKRSTRLQLEVLREGKWSPVIAYEIAAEKSVRHEYSLSGKTKSMKMDLPSGALEAMVQNDLTRNWKSYCEKFLTGKKISA
ncbi:LysM peptidoglycan-binding domain-containing protein [Candidatus Obscuribacterales bacterium]|nr:LysM peptidoglycan-binding domain-containing protein [Candidatus Obscuribacterales bacterium]